MPPILSSKKKSELVVIAAALGISGNGTKDELCNRLKKHLDDNQSDLEDDPQFAGLYSKRKRASQPPSSRFAPDEPARVKTRVVAVSPIIESTPAKDLRDVSMFLKSSPFDKTPAKNLELTPTRLPLPPSPERSIIDHIPPIVATIKKHEQNLKQNSRETVLSMRYFCSNSKNIWSLTALGELFYILSVILSMHSYDVPLSKHSSFTDFTLKYPQWSNVQSASFWTVILHWALPTLVLPALFGMFISFHPVTRMGDEESPIAPLDFLTASIIRLAAQVLYPYDTIQFDRRLDVLGFKWRVLAASVSVAFAFAESISLAPEVVARPEMPFQTKRLLTNEPTLVEDEE